MDETDRMAALAALGRLGEAEAGLRRIVAREPASDRARANLALVLMAQGRYAEAAPYYESRHAVRRGARPKPAFPFPEWAGEDLRGKRLMIFPEQGFGDEIMYARFARRFAEAGAQVTLICAPALARLFANCLSGVRVLAASGEVSFDDPDYWTMMSAILPASGLSPAQLPNRPYLSASPARAGGVGVKARGSPQHDNDPNRSLPDEFAARLLGLPGALDLDPAATGAADFQETAEIVAGLDLVISVDTSIAHLAGAMGKPVWILLPKTAVDWRWMISGATTPWYPSARLFRQETPGDWAAVIDRVTAEALDQSSEARAQNALNQSP
jgi:hypothetical protein